MMNSNRQVILDYCFTVKLIKPLIFLNTQSNACLTETKESIQLVKISGNLSQHQ